MSNINYQYPQKEGIERQGAEKVIDQFHVFVDKVIDYSLSEFKPFKIVHLDRLPGNKTAKSVLTPIIKDELKVYREAIKQQFNVVVGYAEAELDGDVNREEFHRAFIQSDPFYQNYEGRFEKREFEEDLIARLEDMGGDMAVLIESGEEEFWDAVFDCFDEDEARMMLNKHFTQTPMLDQYLEDIELTLQIGGRFINKEIEYTDEAIRTIKYAETELKEDIGEKLTQLYN